MGGNLTKEQQAHIREVGQIIESNKNFLQRRNYYPSKKKLITLFKFIWQEVRDYPPTGRLDLRTWTTLGEQFHREPRAPPEILTTWKGVIMALQNHLGRNLPPATIASTPPPAYEEQKQDLSQIKPLEDPPKLYPSLSGQGHSPVLQAEKRITPCAPPALCAVENSLTPTDEVGPLKRGIDKAKQEMSLSQEDWELLSAYPIDYSGAQPAYQELPFSVMKELKSALANNGVQSPYFKGLMDNVAVNYNLTPTEWRGLAKMLLTSTQYLLWTQAFEAECITQQQANPGLPVDQIRGAGLFANRAQQLQMGRLAVSCAREAAVTAFYSLGDFATPASSSFTRIKQGNSEPYDKFIERLQQAVDRDIKNPEANKILMRKLAFENANADCTKILAPLNVDNSKTLIDFLKAAAVVGSQTFQMEALASAISVNLAQGPVQRSQSGARPRTGNCFNCGKPGHFKNQCRAARAGPAPMAKRPSTPCPRCGKMGHWARECRSPNQAQENSGN